MWPLLRGLIACFLECVKDFEVSVCGCLGVCVCVCEFQEYVESMKMCLCALERVHIYCIWRVIIICILYVQEHVCVYMRNWAGAASKPSQTSPDPPSAPPCDRLSWMLMFCDGCGANKCFWHSTGSHYRSSPNGLARALMSRQVSQPQPLYQSHMLLMQKWGNPPPTRTLPTLTRTKNKWILLLFWFRFFFSFHFINLYKSRKWS